MNRDPLHTSTPLETGQVAYAIADVGTITLGYNPARHPEDDTCQLLVMYGNAGSTNVYEHMGRARPDAPQLFGIHLIGHCIVAIDDALDYLSSPPERRSSWWVRAQRRTAGGELGDVPDGTRTRLAGIVADVIEDFLDRPDADDLLDSHRRHHALSRAADARDRLADIEEEIATWQILAQRELDLVEQQHAWAEGQRTTTAPQPPTPPERPRSWRPLTWAGTHYLARAFPQMR